MRAAIRELEPRDAVACDAIVAGLPEWFGNEQGIRACAHAVRPQAGLVASDETGVTGFLTWTLDRGSRRSRGWRCARRPVAEVSGARSWTRACYLANGFESVAELDIWDGGNPAVLLRRSL